MKPSSSSLYAESKSAIILFLVSGGRARGRKRDQTQTGFGVKNVRSAVVPARCLRFSAVSYVCLKAKKSRLPASNTSLLGYVAGRGGRGGCRCDNTTAPMSGCVSTLRRLDCQNIPVYPSTQGMVGRSVRFRCTFGVISSRTPDVSLVTSGNVGAPKGGKIQTSALSCQCRSSLALRWGSTSVLHPL